MCQSCGFYGIHLTVLYFDSNLCYRIPHHEKSNGYVKIMGRKIFQEASIKVETQKWLNVLKHIIDVNLFSAESGLAFHSSSQGIDDSTMATFLV